MKNKKTIFSAILFFALFGLAHSSQAATLYVSANGSGTACSSGTPCALAYAIGTKCLAGDTIILNSGTYTDTSVNLTNASKHANLTITATPEVISALGSFIRGIPSGTDNRPYFSGKANSPGMTECHSELFDVTVPGVRLSYLRARGNAYPCDWPGAILTIDGRPFTIDHSELWNGGELILDSVSQGVTISDNHLHDTSHWAPFPFVYNGDKKIYGTPDVHAISIGSYESGQAATSFSEGTKILRNTIHDAGGNGIQENTRCYISQSNSGDYLTIDGNEFYNVMKQPWDSKGTNHVIYSNNISWWGDHTGNADVDYGHITANQPNDCPSVTMDDWQIFNNIAHGSINSFFSWNSQGSSPCSNIRLYNNVIYDNNKAAWYPGAVVKLCGDAGSTFYNNVVVNNLGNPTNTGGVETCGSGNNVKNNIFWNNGTKGNVTNDNWMCTNSGTPDHNYFNGTVGRTTGTNAITNCFTSGNCPGFVNLAINDFRLLSNSPAKDAGATLASPYNVDSVGVSRPQGSAFDIGAYEYSSGVNDTTPPAAPTGLSVQ